MKTNYWWYLSRSLWSYLTLIMGGLLLASGFGAPEGQPIATWIAFVSGVLCLLANPVIFLWYKAKENKKE